MVSKGIKKFFGGSTKSKKQPKVKTTTVTATNKIVKTEKKPVPVVASNPVVRNNVPKITTPEVIPPFVAETRQPSLQESVQPEPPVVEQEPESEPESEPEPEPEPEPTPVTVVAPVVVAPIAVPPSVDDPKSESEEEVIPVESEAESETPQETKSGERSMDNTRDISNDETVSAHEADEKRCPTSVDDDSQDDLDELECKRVDTLHADIKLPRFAKSGDYLDVQHGQDTKTIKVPTGTKGGDEFTVRFIQNKSIDEIVPTTSAFCCM